MFVCLSVCLSVCMYVCTFVCLVNMEDKHSYSDSVAGGNHNSEPIIVVGIDSYWGVRLRVAKVVIYFFCTHCFGYVPLHQVSTFSFSLVCKIFPQGFNPIPIELLRACLQKKLILHYFDMAFFLAVGSLGYQILRRPGVCRVLPKCGQLVPMLRQVRV